MSERLEFKGDYMGFTYNKRHSSEFGIVRVSDGSRFNENLLPTMQDKTVQVPGGDGTYYFGSYYTQRQFSVSFAFDALTENELAELKRHFGNKGVHDLIFDETPYKVWSAKVTGTATIKYIPFDEGDTHRLYKGEGSIQFTCYYPFARCRSVSRDFYKDIEEYNGLTNEEKEAKIDEWWIASRISNGGNFGDIPVSFTKIISSNDGSKQVKFSDTEYVSWSRLPGDAGKVTLDTKLGLAKGLDGNIYNQYIDGNITLKIPVDTDTTKTRDLIFTCQYI